MSDEEKSKSWWTTLPGVITSLTATVTAVAGLVAAITQTGWFRPQTPPAMTKPASSPPSAQPSAAAPALPTQDPPPAASSTSRAKPTSSVGLPAMRDYKLGTATFTLLKAELSAQTAEKDALQIRLRMMNHDRFAAFLG